MRVRGYSGEMMIRPSFVYEMLPNVSLKLRNLVSGRALAISLMILLLQTPLHSPRWNKK